LAARATHDNAAIVKMNATHPHPRHVGGRTTMPAVPAASDERIPDRDLFTDD
jgi:hypothetical protein